MGIHCQINLFKPSDGAYLPGSVVCGVIKYGVDEVTIFDKITVSLKGHGLVVIEEVSKKSSTYTNRENYVNIDDVIENEKGKAHEIGMYEARFQFKLPEDIPASLKYYKNNGSYSVNCDIVYYVRIKFERPGFLNFTKRFKKELTVMSKVKPTLSTEPIIYGERKKLFQLFTNKDSIVNIKAVIANSVTTAGGTFRLEYEVSNDTNLIVKGVQIKLVENYTFTTYGGKEIQFYSDVESTNTKTGSIQSGEIKDFDIFIDVPSDLVTLGHSKIMARNYLVVLTAELPFPHINAKVQIPVEILYDDIMTDADNSPDSEKHLDYDNPPTYWVAMGEMSKDDEFNAVKDINLHTIDDLKVYK